MAAAHREKIIHIMQLDLKSTVNRTIIDFKKLGFKQLRVLGKYNYSKAEGGLSEHVHKGMLEICYYDKGSQTFSVGNKEHLVRGGDVFLHYPNEKHSSGGYPEEKGCLYWMIISLSGKENGLDHDTRDISQLCDRIISQHKRHFKGSMSLKKTFEEIFSACKKNEDEFIRRIRINMLARQFLLELIDCSAKNEKETDSARLNKVLDYIDNNIDSSISVARLAREINISESRFKGIFKEFTGFTPGDYIQRKRVDKAISIIKGNPQLSFADLAYELHFSSPQYFSTVIRKYTGMPPQSLRKK
jgi:AraC-like DNA-binding protein